LKEHDIDHIERFLVKISLFDLKKLTKNTILSLKFSRFNENLNKVTSIGDDETVKCDGNTDYINLEKNLEYNYFDYHVLRIEVETSEKEKKVFNIPIYSVLQNNLNPVKLPFDLSDKESVYNYNSSADIKHDIPYLLLNFQRSTKILNFNIYTFFVEFTLEQPSTEVRKLIYKLYIKNKSNPLSNRLFESKEVSNKKKFSFNIAFIKRSELYGNSDDDSKLSIEISEVELDTTTVIGEAEISFHDIKDRKISEINSITVFSVKDKEKSEGKIKLVEKEMNPTVLYDEIINGFQFKFGMAFDLSSQFDNQEINTAYSSILESLKKIVPYYNIKEHIYRGIGILDENNKEFCELNVTNSEYYIIYEVIQDYNREKEKQKLAPTSLKATNYLKQVLAEVKKNKTKEYSIHVIIINGPFEDEKEVKDVLVELSKQPVSFIIIGLKSKQSTFSYGFLSHLSKNLLNINNKTLLIN